MLNYLYCSGVVLAILLLVVKEGWVLGHTELVVLHQIVNLHVNTGNRYAQPVQPRIRMASAMDESHSAPAVAGGTSQIVVSVSGQVQLDKWSISFEAKMQQVLK